MTLCTANTKIIPVEVPVSNILKSVNFYIVERNHSLFLIDAGVNNDTYWDALMSALQKHDYQLSDLDAILLTHHHPDHIGLVYRIASLIDIPVYIHPYGLPKLKGDPEYIYMSYTFFKDLFNKLNCGDFGKAEARRIYQNRLNQKETVLDWNIQEITQQAIFDLKIIDIPGHAPDQVAFHLEDENIIFCGDLLIEHQAVSAFVEPALDGSRINALQQHRKSLEKIIQLNPELALSGHGTIIKEPAILAKRRLDAIDKKAKGFLTMIEKGISTGSELVKQRHPVKYEKIFYTVIRDVLSFLDYLEDTGKVRKEKVNGIWHYTAMV